MAKYLLVLLVACSLQLTLTAQENSPYSRYGIGDLAPNHNIITRGMGGISAGYADNFTLNSSINFTNPASFSNFNLTVFDIGGDIDVRTLKSISPVNKFTATNTLISYLAIGFPIASEKMKKKGMTWGLSFGLKPVSKINYKIEKNERLTNIDSAHTIFEGNGGINQFYIGTGLKIKNVSFGLITGYMFGTKDYSTKLDFINDTVSYFRSNSSNNTRFGSLFLNAGVQYTTEIKKGTLRLGAYANLKQKINAKQDVLRETYGLDVSGTTFQIDSVYQQKDVKGKLELPATVGLGFTYANTNWLVGADLEITNWDKYRFYGAKDALQNTWVFRVGAQYLPAKPNTPQKKYFSFVKYRAGFYYGPDYIKISSTNRNEFGFTTGASFPLVRFNGANLYDNRGLADLNLGLEIANRGNQKTNLQENIFRLSVGVTMNNLWFRKRKYD